MLYFLVGFLAGIAATAPFTVLAMRRTARRVRLLEERARTAERLAELGTLTGGLAHEIKNPLSTIGLNLQLLSETLNEAGLSEPLDRRLRSRIESLTAEAQRLRGILEDFLAFAGRMRLDAQPARINDVIDQLADFYLPQAEASGVRLITQLDPSAGEARFDLTLLKQALLNLFINATQAMVESRYSGKPHGGSSELIVRTAGNAEQITVDVIDTGPGIDEATQKKLFQPYFSTKKGGTGLGLPTTRRIIHEHAGDIRVHSEPGKGSAFTIRLPRSGPPTAHA